MLAIISVHWWHLTLDCYQDWVYVIIEDNIERLKTSYRMGRPALSSGQFNLIQSGLDGDAWMLAWTNQACYTPSRYR